MGVTSSRERLGRALVTAVAVLGTACGSANRTGGPAATTSAGTTPLATSPPAGAHAVLERAWRAYRATFIEDGRVVDPRRGGGTTSEGQAYALLRAVWMDDRPAFDAVWGWTRAHLAVRGDHLLAWLWGRRADGSSGVLDRHSATDADTDAALALALAAGRWGRSGDRDSARAMASDIWRLETDEIAGSRVAVAGDWAAQQEAPVVNPSYLAPYAYRVFASVDSDHPWSTLVDGSYAVLERCTAATLNGARSAGLPPDWCALARGDGRVVPSTQQAHADDYGYDAFRVMWRLALDLQWNGEARARRYLDQAGLLRARWRATGRLAAVYGHDGSVVDGSESVDAYGGDIGAFVAADPASARRILDGKLVASLQGSGTRLHFGDPSDYYGQNWAWFGIALAAGALPAPGGG